MQIVIEIHAKDYQAIKNGHIPFSVLDAIMKGTPLPEHHGRLIDADEVIKNAEKWGKDNPNKYIADRNADISVIIKNEPTIIEGSDSE